MNETYLIFARNKTTNEVILVRSTPSVLDVKSLEDGVRFAMGDGYEVFTQLRA